MVEKIAFSNYETTFIVDPSTPELDVQKLVTRLQNQITQQDGQIFSTDTWGKQRLAYPIGKLEYGFYATLVFSYPTAEITDFRKDLSISPEVVRELTISLDKEGITPGELKRVDPFKEQVPLGTSDRPAVRSFNRAPSTAHTTVAKEATPAVPPKDEATRMKELEEKLGKLLEEE